ncbi:hypothetical protein LSAT2_000208 [Lamellibrachia satsuma]|nr:hypothetical protein LSAT2_000208 [Lamellibrachia satsuma]
MAPRVWSSKLFAVMVLVMMLVATTETSSDLIAACIKRCRKRHARCLDDCMSKLTTDPTRGKFCYTFCNHVKDYCIVACHRTEGLF